MKLLTVLISILCGCAHVEPYRCGEMVPVIVFAAEDVSFDGKRCLCGKWKPVPTGPWYECTSPAGQ
jgi:hypothetical protein